MAKIKKTARGFNYTDFKDFNGVPCSMQASSVATDNCIWLGADDIGLKQFKNGYWGDVDTNENYIANNRMHLSQDQVKKLLPLLTHFALTGEVGVPTLKDRPKGKKV